MIHAKKNKLPKSDITPQMAHTIKQNQILPEYRRAAVGETKMPEPIITPIMILVADIKPIPRFSPTGAFSSFTFTTAAEKKNNKMVEINCHVCLFFIRRIYIFC